SGSLHAVTSVVYLTAENERALPFDHLFQRRPLARLVRDGTLLHGSFGVVPQVPWGEGAPWTTEQFLRNAVFDAAANKPTQVLRSKRIRDPSGSFKQRKRKGRKGGSGLSRRRTCYAPCSVDFSPPSFD